jgi:hypothetical protein
MVCMQLSILCFVFLSVLSNAYKFGRAAKDRVELDFLSSPYMLTLYAAYDVGLYCVFVVVVVARKQQSF